MSSWQRRFLIILFSSFFLFLFFLLACRPLFNFSRAQGQWRSDEKDTSHFFGLFAAPGPKAYLLAAWLLGIYIQRLTASLGFPAPYLPTYSPHSLPNPPHSSSSFDSHAHPFKTSVRRFAFVIRYLRGFPI